MIFMPYTYNKRMMMTTVLLIFISNVIFAQRIAIIDAGSSGSRLFIYDVVQTETPTIRLIYPTTPEQKKRSKGRPLSSIANHPDSVRVFLENMTSNYKGNQTSMYILATAGMRLKPEAQTQAIYDKLEELGLVNGYQVKGAMTISGQYEGLYGWLATNYDHGNLKIKHTDKGNILTLADYPHGILEIGGASMQLAFTTQTETAESLFRPGINYIYCKSYLGGGVDQIYKNTERKGAGYKFKLNLDNVSSQYQSNTWFMGLGIPVNLVIQGTNEQDQNKTYKKRINKYIHSLDDFEDSMQNYHPRINAHYVKWVSDLFDLEEKLIQPITDSSWTLGAALDILIYNESPERFDYTIRK